MAKTVQFVSKPVDPPINDGTKHVVLCLATHLERYRPRVMTTRQVTDVGDGVLVDGIYETASSYAPSLLNNLRAAKFLATRCEADLWHFVFAPNKRSSQMGRSLSRLRRRPTVQTIASRPKTFDTPESLLFGDIVVAQSEDTRQRFENALDAARVPVGKRPRFEVIPPPLGTVRVPTLEETNRTREELGIGPTAPIILYPGDLEMGQGAARVADAARRLLNVHPSAVVVFAYRDKTAVAVEVAAKLEAALLRDVPPARVRFVRESRDILALVRTTAVLLFPVEELYGKVDHPIVLLEAMALGTPVLTYDAGPLGDLHGVERVSPDDVDGLVRQTLNLVDNHGHRNYRSEEQRRILHERYEAAHVARRYEGLYDDLLSR